MALLNNEDRGDLILHLQQRRREIFWKFAINFIICVAITVWIGYKLGWKNSYLFLLKLFAGSLVFLTFNVLFVDNTPFTQIDLHKNGLVFKRIFRKDKWLPISQIQELRVWNVRGRDVRPKLKFQLKDSENSRLSILHEFSDKQIQPILQYLHDNKVDVYTHYLPREEHV